MDANENRELFKQALVEGLNRRFDRELAQAEEALRDPSGVILTPGCDCLGDGLHVDENRELIECCCDECDYLKFCLEAEKGEQK